MKTRALEGVLVPIITPTDSEERVDEPGLRKLIDALIAAGVHGIFAGGSTGEGPLLAPEEWRRLMEISRDAVKGRVPVLAGVMDTSSRRVRDKVRAVRAMGYEYFVLTPSFYLASSALSECIRLFGEAREAAGDMEMIAYNIPQCVGAFLGVDTTCELARRGWIRVCKDSTGNMEHIRQLVTRGREVGLSVLTGDEFHLMDTLHAGVRGIIPGCGSVFPKPFLAAWDAAERKDWAALASAVDEVMRVRPALVAGTNWLAGIKYAASVMGIGSGRPLSPLEPVSPEQKKRIDELLRAEKVAGAERR